MSSGWELGLTFCFEVLTDVAFVPPLVIMHRYRRHFELCAARTCSTSRAPRPRAALPAPAHPEIPPPAPGSYVGVFQLMTGFLYNFCNALNTSVFLTELQWHGLNNILTTTYFLLLLIHLQANSNPTVDIVLRYVAFSAVWIAQIKDGYWNPYWTALVVAAYCIMPICKFCGAMRLPPYDGDKLWKGFCAGLLSTAAFVVGLDDSVDPYAEITAHLVSRRG